MKDDTRLKRKVRNSYIISTVSMTLVLFLLGSVGYLMLVAMVVADSLKESIAVTVELRNGLTPEQRDGLAQRFSVPRTRPHGDIRIERGKIEDTEFRKFVRLAIRRVVR